MIDIERYNSKYDQQYHRSNAKSHLQAERSRATGLRHDAGPFRGMLRLLQIPTRRICIPVKNICIAWTYLYSPNLNTVAACTIKSKITHRKSIHLYYRYSRSIKLLTRSYQDLLQAKTKFRWLHKISQIYRSYTLLLPHHSTINMTHMSHHCPSEYL